MHYLKTAITTLQHKGLPILYVDFSNCQGSEDQIALVKLAMGHVLKGKNEKLYVINNWSGQRMSKKVFNTLKEYGRQADPHIALRVVIGLDPVLRIFLSGFNFVTRKSVTQTAQTMEEGLEQLYAHSQQRAV